MPFENQYISWNLFMNKNSYESCDTKNFIVYGGGKAT